MLFKILKKDFQRNKIITIALLIFILTSSLLVSSGARIIIELFGAIDNLLEKANVPHFVQMHAGEIDQSAIDKFVSDNHLVKGHQTIEMLLIDSSDIYFGDSQTSDKNSVMENGFVKQSSSFDFLLNLDNEIIQVSKGEIAVPIYYMQQKGLQIGDSIRISKGSFNKVFTITHFVRDALMNPSIISSKRFIVNEEDLDVLNQNLGRVEYLIEFQLNNIKDIREFSNSYQNTELPQKGPTVDYSLFRLLNALTDGIVVAVIILVSILLIVIALLCLRFTILTTIEEDYKEIGVMKAIGIRQRHIKKIYLIKYIAMAALACIGGYLLSLGGSKLFTANIALYIGSAKRTIWHFLIPLIAAVMLFLIVILFCAIILRRFGKISAVEALRSGTMGITKVNTRFLPLRKNKVLDTNVFLGVKDVLVRFKMYLLLFAIFLISSFIIIVPINFLNTFQSPSVVVYMGAGKSDIRFDLQQSDNTVQKFNNIVEYLEKDSDIEKFSPHVTCKYRVLNSEGIWENINVETGDFSIFPLEYLNGTAPKLDNEIALSKLNADELGKTVGDTLLIVVNGNEQEMLISGIYQDVTNGGKTAKAMVLPNFETALWYTVNIDVKPDVDISDKIAQYTGNFPFTKVTHVEDYLKQTLGSTIKQVQLVTRLAIVIAVLISILITSLFVKMLIAKDASQIAIMRSIGFTLRKIKVQYIVRTLLVLIIGIIVGTILSNTAGQGLVSILMSFMGASKIQFVINPIVAYVLCPLALILSVSITTLISASYINKIDIAKMLRE